MPRSPWQTRGSPLVRRASPAPVQPPPPDAHGRLPDLVLECLLRPPQPRGLRVAQPGRPDGRQFRRARGAHRLEPWEELVAVWPWATVAGLFSAAPSSLIFTTRGIAIAEPRLRLAIGYDMFSDYTFSYDYIPGGRAGPDICQLVIDGPTPWRSPSADQSAELIADDLTRIKELAAGQRC